MSGQSPGTRYKAWRATGSIAVMPLAWMRHRRGGRDHRLAETAARYFKSLPLRDDVVLYQVEPGSEQAHLARRLLDTLLAAPGHAHLQHVVVADPVHRAIWQQDENAAVHVVAPHSDDYLRLVHSAKYVVSDFGLEDYVVKKAGQVYACLAPPLPGGTESFGTPAAQRERLRRWLVGTDLLVAPDRSTCDALISWSGAGPFFRGATLAGDPEFALPGLIAATFDPGRISPEGPKLAAKRNLLFYPGGLAQNGVTASFLALLELIDYERFNVAVLLPPEAVRREARHRIDRRASVFVLPEDYGLRWPERLALTQLSLLGSVAREQVPIEALQRVARRSLGDITFDCAINFSGYGAAAAALIAFGVDAKRRVIYLHNDLDADRKVKHPRLHSVFSLYDFYDELVCVSPASLRVNSVKIDRYLRANYGFGLRRPMRCVPNPIVPESILSRSLEPLPAEPRTQQPLRAPTFVALGRLSPEKNHRRLILAFAPIAKRHPDVSLAIAGQGALLPDLRQLLSELGLEHRVQLLGHLSNPLPLLRASACMVSSSDIEGQPVSLLEALTLGKPVIATDIAGHRDLLAAACLVPGTVQALTQAMGAFLAAPERFVTPFDAVSYSSGALAQFYHALDRSTPQHRLGAPGHTRRSVDKHPARSETYPTGMIFEQGRLAAGA